MAPHQLVGDGACDVGEPERARLGGDLGVEDDLQEQVAELVAQRCRVAAVDRLEHLVRLLDHVGPQALVCLLAIPRAAARARADAP